jgi:prevent-host-death family protein
MKSVDCAQAQDQLDEMLDEAQRQPIVICRQGRETAILMSVVEYKRLRVTSLREFLALRDDIAREASAAGLTDNRLSELLSDD